MYRYLKELLKLELNNSPFIVTCFDEDFNKKPQNRELHLHVRYWDVNKKRAQTRFWTSSFVWHSTHKDILENLESCVEGLDVTKMSQVSMDGPNVQQSDSQKFGPILLNLLTIVMVFLHPSNCHVKAIWTSKMQFLMTLP